MDGRLVSSYGFICTTRSFYEVSRDCDALFTMRVNKGKWRVVNSMLEVKQEVGPNAITPFARDAVSWLILVLQDDACNMNRIRVDLRTGRNGIISWLKTWDGRDDDIKWYRPCRCVARCRM